MKRVSDKPIGTPRKDGIIPFSAHAGRESHNDALDKCRELMDRFEQRLTLDNPRLIQRYVESKLHLLIHFRVGRIDEEFVALLQWEENISRLEERTNGREIFAGKHLLHHAQRMCSRSRLWNMEPTVISRRCFSILLSR